MLEQPAQPVEIQFEYPLTDRFCAWLEKNRPGVFRECSERKFLVLWAMRTWFNPRTGKIGRVRADFPFQLDEVECENSSDFDRQIDSDMAAVVLDRHPAILEVEIPK
jgi:hypothetical protein